LPAYPYLTAAGCLARLAGRLGQAADADGPDVRAAGSRRRQRGPGAAGGEGTGSLCSRRLNSRLTLTEPVLLDPARQGQIGPASMSAARSLRGARSLWEWALVHVVGTALQSRGSSRNA